MPTVTKVFMMVGFLAVVLGAVRAFAVGSPAAAETADDAKLQQPPAGLFRADRQAYQILARKNIFSSLSLPARIATTAQPQPSTPVRVSTSPMAGMIVRGIITGNGFNRVLIEDTRAGTSAFYRLGDVVGAVKILAIEPMSITVRPADSAGQEYRVYVGYALSPGTSAAGTASGAAGTVSGGTSGGNLSPAASIMERMKARRRQQLGLPPEPKPSATKPEISSQHAGKSSRHQPDQPLVRIPAAAAAEGNGQESIFITPDERQRMMEILGTLTPQQQERIREFLRQRGIGGKRSYIITGNGRIVTVEPDDEQTPVDMVTTEPHPEQSSHPDEKSQEE